MSNDVCPHTRCSHWQWSLVVSVTWTSENQRTMHPPATQPLTPSPHNTLFVTHSPLPSSPHISPPNPVLILALPAAGSQPAVIGATGEEHWRPTSGPRTGALHWAQFFSLHKYESCWTSEALFYGLFDIVLSRNLQKIAKYNGITKTT